MKLHATLLALVLATLGCGEDGHRLPKEGSLKRHTGDLDLACRVWTAYAKGVRAQVDTLLAANAAAQPGNGLDNDALRTPAEFLGEATYRQHLYCVALQPESP